MTSSPHRSARIVRRQVPDNLPDVHTNALVNRLLAMRGVTSPDALKFSLADLPRPHTLLGIDVAVERLLLAHKRSERVLIVGDYDCDGATSTTLAVLVLRAFGYEHVDYLVPNRFDYGYGLSPAIVDVAAARQPDLIVTVDNGVASVDGVERAREHGIDVVVTDHHLPPAVLPNAIAIVNPNIPGATFPSGNLAGVGVIFYVLLALRAELVESGISTDVKLADYLDLVAIGTVADVVPLDYINRILVEQGLRRIRAGATRHGVLALLARAGRVPERITSMDIGFAIGPRLNAAGRLDDMAHGIECLLSDDPVKAHELAVELDTLNQKRRSIEKDMRDDAELALEKARIETTDTALQFSVVLFNESWHQGVIGILAGRIKEQLHRPVVVFAADEPKAGQTPTIKGSARSIPGVHIRDVLDAVATHNPELIEKFGGHAMAAGLTLPRAHLAEFEIAFEAEVNRVLAGKLPEREWITDGSLSDKERSMANARLLEQLSPWGQSFPAPLFDDCFLLERTTVVGTGHLKLVLRSVNADAAVAQGNQFNAIAFNTPDQYPASSTVRLVYSLSENRYRGSSTLQLQVQHLEAQQQASSESTSD